MNTPKSYSSSQRRLRISLSSSAMRTTAGFLSCFIHCPPGPALFMLYEPVVFMWSTRFGRLYETNRTNQTDRTTNWTGPLYDVRVIEVLTCRDRDSASC